MAAPLRPVPATTPDEGGWSIEALVRAFAVSLGGWLRHFGVRPADIPDAIQDALFEAWQVRHSMPAETTEARREMLRIASKIAHRCLRQYERLVCVEETDVPDPQWTEAWIAERMLWLEALNRLDDDSRELIIAHELEEQTYVEMSSESGVDKDTIRSRVEGARAKLRKEVERLLRIRAKRKEPSAACMLIMGLDALDRAILRAIVDVEREFGLCLPPAHSLQSAARSTGSSFATLPMGLLVSVLALVPGQGFHVTPMHAVKISDVPLPDIVIQSDPPVPEAREAPSATLPARHSPPPQPAPNRTARKTGPSPAPDKDIVKSLVEIGAPSAH